MKENIFKAVTATAFACLSAYFGELVIPLAILLCAMVVDYISGMTKAWITKSFCSRTGIVGIVKKVLYLLLVAAAMIVDWVITSLIGQTGFTMEASYLVALIVIIWLIINEIISVLENLAASGVPMPAFLTKLVKRLKLTVEEKTGEKEE